MMLNTAQVRSKLAEGWKLIYSNDHPFGPSLRMESTEGASYDVRRDSARALLRRKVVVTKQPS